MRRTPATGARKIGRPPGRRNGSAAGVNKIPDRASKFGTELQELVFARNARRGGKDVRAATRRVSKILADPKDDRPSREARIWMDWDKAQDTKDGRVTLAYGSWRDNFVVVHKPSGVSLMDEQGGDSIERRIAKELDETLGPVQRETRAIIFPHRIDKWVSGLQVVALDHTTASLLQRSLRRHLWHKRYRALVQLPPACSVEGQTPCFSTRCCLVNPSLTGSLVDTDANSSDLVLKRKGRLESRISKRMRDNTPSMDDRDQCAQCTKVSQHILSHPFVIRHLLYRSVPEGYTDPYSGKSPVLSRTTFLHLQTDKEKKLALYEAVLHTGKTHQLRLHFSEAGFPIVADPYYNTHFVEYLRLPDSPPPGYRHLVDYFDVPSKIGLQAFLLELPHPYTNRLIKPSCIAFFHIFHLVELPMPSIWRQLGFNDERKAPVPEATASPQERFERFVRELESEDPAIYRPATLPHLARGADTLTDSAADTDAANQQSALKTPAISDEEELPRRTWGGTQGRRLYISNFPSASMTEEDAVAFFTQYGPVKQLKQFENAVLVDYATEKDATLLLTQSGKITINGRTLSIARAERKIARPIMSED